MLRGDFFSSARCLGTGLVQWNNCAVNFPMSQLVKGWDNRKNANNTVLLGKLWEYDGEALTAGSQTQIQLCLLAPTKSQCFKTGAELFRCVCTMLPSQPPVDFFLFSKDEEKIPLP